MPARELRAGISILPTPFCNKIRMLAKKWLPFVEEGISMPCLTRLA